MLLERARELGLGVRSFVSLGNTADVSSNDLLAAWFDDPGVTAAALYLESFGNARKFARFARRFSERKPLLAVVGGARRRDGAAASPIRPRQPPRTSPSERSSPSPVSSGASMPTTLLRQHCCLPSNRFRQDHGWRAQQRGRDGHPRRRRRRGFRLVVPEFTAALSDLLTASSAGHPGRRTRSTPEPRWRPSRWQTLSTRCCPQERSTRRHRSRRHGRHRRCRDRRRLEEVLAPSGHSGGAGAARRAGCRSPGWPDDVRLDPPRRFAPSDRVSYVKWRAVPAAPLPVRTPPSPWPRGSGADRCFSTRPTEGRWLAASEARHLLDPTDSGCWDVW